MFFNHIDIYNECKDIVPYHLIPYNIINIISINNNLYVLSQSNDKYIKIKYDRYSIIKYEVLSNIIMKSYYVDYEDDCDRVQSFFCYKDNIYVYTHNLIIIFDLDLNLIKIHKYEGSIYNMFVFNHKIYVILWQGIVEKLTFDKKPWFRKVKGELTIDNKDIYYTTNNNGILFKNFINMKKCGRKSIRKIIEKDDFYYILLYKKLIIYYKDIHILTLEDSIRDIILLRNNYFLVAYNDKFQIWNLEGKCIFEKYNKFLSLTQLDNSDILYTCDNKIFILKIPLLHINMMKKMNDLHNIKFIFS